MQSRWFPLVLLAAALGGWMTAELAGDWMWLDHLTELVRTAFFAALKMIVAPLIFFSLFAGVMELRNSSSMGRLGAVTLAYYLVTTGIAVCIGLIVVLWFHPWTSLPPLVDDPSVLGGLTLADARLIDPGDGSTLTLVSNLLLRMLSNPFLSLSQMNVLGILVAAILFGLAAALTVSEDSPLPKLMRDLAQITYRVAAWVLRALPLGLFAIAYQMADQISLDTATALLQLGAVVLGATAFHGLVVLPLLGWLASGIPPWRLLSKIAAPLISALSTSSSAATLPLSMQTAEEKLGVDRARCAFVLPLGATANMDGTALFEGIAAIFLAYMFSVDLNTTSIIAIFLVAMLSSVGAPGIPSGSMAGMQMVMLAVGIPLEAIGLLLLIERPLDTFRTAVNVEGDLIATLVAKRFS